MAGADLGPLFVPPTEAHYLWVVIAAFSAATILVALIALVRGRLPAALSGAGLLLLPVFTYVLGNLFVLEKSKEVEFCGSCHETMSPLVESMKGQTATLAASHYQRGAVSHSTACYDCHSGYGIWGDVEAKLAGVNHMLHTVTGSYEYPLRHVGAFDHDSCLGCHAGAAPFRAVEAHRDPDIQRALVDREMGCAGLCHAAAHPAEALEGAEAWALRAAAAEGP